MIARIRAVFYSRDIDREFDAELESHLGLLVEEHIRRGVPREEAERLARIQLGGSAQLREAHRETRGLPFLDSLLQDLRYALRGLRHNPAFSVFIILIVGLGIGASSTIFSIVNALLIRPLPFSDSRRLVWISNLADDSVTEWNLQVGHFVDLRDQNRSFSDLAAYNTFSQPGDAKLTGDGQPERLNSLRVSQNFFSLLGVHPSLGRTFTAEECKGNGPGAALLSYGLWKRRYASDPGVVGKTLTLNDAPVTVVGIAPPTFDFAGVFAPANRIDVYLPMPLTEETNRLGNTLAVVGRLKPGAKIENAKAEFQVLADHLQQRHPERNSLRPILMPLEQHVTGRVRPALFVLVWAVGIVMLIVCANVANLQLARAAARQKELAVRAALGAGGRRLIRQMLTEGLVLSCCGGLLGVILAVLGTRLFSGLQAFRIPLLSEVRTDFASLGFSLLVAVLTGLLFGLGPAVQVLSISLRDALQDSSRNSTGTKRHFRIRNVLVVSEIAFACVLIVGAGLLARSFVNVLEVKLGFQPERAAALRIDPSASYSSLAQRIDYYNQVLDRVRSLPGITAAGLTDVLPLVGDRSWQIAAKGKLYPQGHYPQGFIRVISDGYLRAMGIPLRSGRGFTEHDAQSSEPVAVVNETLARTLWPGQNAIGQLVMGEGSQSAARRVVGVVGDVRHRSLEQTPGGELYFPIRQTNNYAFVYLVVRTALPPAALASSIRVALAPIAPEVAGSEFRTVEGLVDQAVSPRRFVVVLLAGFSAFALILAALGIYAVISYSVEQRTGEMAIRMALGAPPRDLQAQIILQTLRLAGLGMLVGSAASLVLARTLGSLLFGVTFTDPLTFGGMLMILTGVAILAGYLPSLRVSRMDPMTALRAN